MRLRHRQLVEEPGGQPGINPSPVNKVAFMNIHKVLREPRSHASERSQGRVESTQTQCAAILGSRIVLKNKSDTEKYRQECRHQEIR